MGGYSAHPSRWQMNTLTAVGQALRFVSEILSAEECTTPVDIVPEAELFELLDDANAPFPRQRHGCDGT
jgi:hypothetical protein